MDPKSILPYSGNGNDWLYSDRIIPVLNRKFVTQEDEIKVELECTGKSILLRRSDTIKPQIVGQVTHKRDITEPHTLSERILRSKSSK